MLRDVRLVTHCCANNKTIQNGLSCTTLSSYYANGGYVVKQKSKTDTAESVNIKM